MASRSCWRTIRQNAEVPVGYLNLIGSPQSLLVFSDFSVRCCHSFGIFSGLHCVHLGQVLGRFFGAVATVWFFWAAASLWNFQFLGGFAFPPLLFLLPGYYFKYWGFVWLPFLAGLSCAVVAGILVHRAEPLESLSWKLLVANFAFLFFFVLSAEVRTSQLMSAAVDAANADCFDSRFFSSSVAIAGEEFQFDVHAVYRKDGDVFIWSYRDTAFFRVPETIYRNLDLMGCAAGRALQAS